MPLILGANSLAAGGYEVDNSLRFNPSSSDYLNRTSGTSTDNKKLTFSFWVKRGDSGREQHFVNSSGTACQTYFASDDKIYFTDGTASGQYKTTQVFRDFSAWYHFVFAEDTTQATASDRIKIYVNGTQITAFDIATTPTLNANSGWNANSTATFIGRYNPSPTGYYYSGYMSEFNFIDGQQLTPSDFGEFDADTGIWKPIAYTGTYGTNGFYLEFKDSSALGDDTSGNTNDFTVNNLTSIDQTTDTPTNNFATLNPLVGATSSTFTNGNLVGTIPPINGSTVANIALPTTGKWYCEFNYTGALAGGGYFVIGVSDMSKKGWNATQESDAQNAHMVGSIHQTSSFGEVGSLFTLGTTSGSTFTITQSTVFGLMWDSDNTTLKLTDGTNTYQSTYTLNNLSIPISFMFAQSEGATTGGVTVNFGAGTNYAPNGYADANGIGNFSYAVPSGYYALCTKNLAEYG